MEKKNIPLIMMLSAGAITWIMTFVQKFELLESFLILLGVMILFYGMGTVIQWAFVSFERRNAQAKANEGEEIAVEEEEEEE